MDPGGVTGLFLMPQMIIANRLADGVVVFFDAAGVWAESIRDGLLLEDEDQAERHLREAKQDQADCLVIGPELIGVEIEDGSPRPTAIREAIRAFGPTVRTDLMESER